MIFPDNPLTFQPRGLIMSPVYEGNNGKIIKWFVPGTKTVVFEWNEDLKNGSHYHAMMIEWDSVHDGAHYNPGEPVPEPWNSTYFGG